MTSLCANGHMRNSTGHLLGQIRSKEHCNAHSWINWEGEMGAGMQYDGVRWSRESPPSWISISINYWLHLIVVEDEFVIFSFELMGDLQLLIGSNPRFLVLLTLNRGGWGRDAGIERAKEDPSRFHTTERLHLNQVWRTLWQRIIPCSPEGGTAKRIWEQILGTFPAIPASAAPERGHWRIG